MMNDIKKLLQLSTDSCYTNVYKVLRELGGNVQAGKDSYIFCDFNYKMSTMLVCHIDTVDDQGGNVTLKDIVEYKGVITNNVGGYVLGADDRAGVYAVLKILRNRYNKKLPLPPVLFTLGEEFGGIGVREFIRDDLLDDKKINFIIEPDRKGAKEYVVYHEPPEEVDKYVQSFGWHKQKGCYSDIYDLTDAYLIPSINVSIGYYLQHTDKEFLVVKEMEESIKTIERMLGDQFSDKLYVGHPGCDGNTEQYEPFDWDAKESLDLLLDEVLVDGVECPMCGCDYYNCTCGYVAEKLCGTMSYKEVDILLNYFLAEDDPLHLEVDNYEFGVF